MSQLLNMLEGNTDTGASVSTGMVAILDEELCDGCRICLPTCNFNALLWISGDDILLHDHWSCTGCGTCVSACPLNALSLQPRKPA